GLPCANWFICASASSRRGVNISRTTLFRLDTQHGIFAYGSPGPESRPPSPQQPTHCGLFDCTASLTAGVLGIFLRFYLPLENFSCLLRTARRRAALRGGACST